MSAAWSRPWIGVREDGFTLINGQNHCLRLDSTGQLMVTAAISTGSTVTPADDVASPGAIIATASFPLIYDRASNDWDRLTGVVVADNLALPAECLLGVANFPLLYDGTNFDRWRGTSVAGAANTAEQLAAGAEDNTNAVIATVPRPLAVSTYAPSLFTNFGADPDVSVKATPGNVFSLTIHNLNAAARYAQLHNKASAPANPDVPLLTFLVPTGAMLVIGPDFFGHWGVHFSTGIAFGFSTTEATYTAGSAADQFVQILYK